MPPAKLKRTLLVFSASALLAGCGLGERHEAEIAAAPVRSAVEALAPSWEKGRCLCVGHFGGEEVADFPAGVIDDLYARHPWLRRWSECAPLYGMKQGLPGCRSMTDYICTAAERPNVPQGARRILCHVNGKNELLVDEYNVTDGDPPVATRLVSAAFERLKHPE